MSIEVDFQPAPLVCPRCNQEFEYIEGQVQYSCTKCGNSIDNIQAQFAYSRGYDAFFTGQLAYMEIPPNRRSRRAYAQQAHDVMQIFSEAYSAIQVAFQSNLAESQRYKAIEIMASIAVLFMQIDLISPMEANYWTSLMMEQVNHKEWVELSEKLSQPSSGLLNFLARLRWHSRKRQLEKALVRVEKKIHLLEQNIAFITPPHVRKISSTKIGKY